MKPITDYSRFQAILPYASEIFGVYQPLIGWKAKRKLDWIERGTLSRPSVLDALSKRYRGDAAIEFNSDYVAKLVRVAPGHLTGPRPRSQNGGYLAGEIASALPSDRVPSREEWDALLTADSLTKLLQDRVFPTLAAQATSDIRAALAAAPPRAGETPEAAALRRRRLAEAIEGDAARQFDADSAMAGAMLDLVQQKEYDALARAFYFDSDVDTKKLLADVTPGLRSDYRDPFLTFDPNKDVKDVTVSPLGIVHLFRQYFFEFDTFLGTPTGHVWLSPGSTVELIEASTRRVLTEKTVEQATESINRTARETTDQDELSEAVKQDNRDDTKLGITATVNQSWGTGNATATASLNMDRTQQVAREQTHKRMRQQTEKLSTEIRQNYKTTFKTVTETTDTSSRRYLLTNTGNSLINYEMRRKMRQVGVQVQDIGTYLCWETFVDDPGNALGLANLVHLAKPADLVAGPNPKEIDYPPEVSKTFQANAAWDFGDSRQYNEPVGFRTITTIALPVQPDPGYFPKNPDGYVDLALISQAGKDLDGVRYTFRGKLIGGTQLQIGVVLDPSGLKREDRIDFVLGGAISFAPTDAKKKEIDDANADLVKTKFVADRKDEQTIRESYVTAAKERIKLASNIKARKFEDLREEERTIVYRNLIRSLMGDGAYYDFSSDDARSRHVLSELISAIFDVDKMLYFVAPEWWKPRPHSRLALGTPEIGVLDGETTITWTDQVSRPDNYFITEDSTPARLGSSLGWLLQLDGDDLRDAFLNAPWVKTVIPIRPGKELAAIHWLQNANIEGADGLDAAYAAPTEELAAIKEGLLADDPADPVVTHGSVTLLDAIRFLCREVAAKHAESISVQSFPKGPDIRDDDKVVSTPIEKVYEHGFYPLKGGFRVDPNNPDPNNPDPNFQVFDQWIEILPTDQVVPVEVQYDPKTGRQL